MTEDEMDEDLAQVGASMFLMNAMINSADGRTLRALCHMEAPKAFAVINASNPSVERLYAHLGPERAAAIQARVEALIIAASDSSPWLVDAANALLAFHTRNDAAEVNLEGEPLQ